MLRYIVKRLLWMIPTILGILLIIFTINDLMPGDPALNSLGANYTEELYQQRREEMGLNRPFVVRYVEYVVDLATRLDFGESYSTLRPVKNMIAERLGVTLLLGIYGSLITIVLGVIIGILSAVRQYSILDYVTTILATFFAAMPNFWLALMGVIIFSQNLQLLPASGLSTWKHWIMPVICIGIGPIALVVRMTRTSMLDVVRQDYITTARAKGQKESVVIRRHALRNALIPVITTVGAQLGILVSGSVVVETIFGMPGLGSLMMTAINNKDFPIIEGCVLILAALICIINLVTDLIYGFVDPRIMAQYTAGKKKKRGPAGEKEGAVHA